MKSLYKYRKENKKGVSDIIITILMVGLVLVAAGVIFGVVNGIIKSKVKSSEACFGNFDKITINRLNTCYDTATHYFRFSVEVGEINNVEKIIVSVGGTRFDLGNSTINNVANFGSTGFGTDIITIPGKEEAKTYITNSFSAKPNSMKIAPVLNGEQCEVSDSLNEIADC